jgi:hypothetical protein
MNNKISIHLLSTYFLPMLLIKSLFSSDLCFFRTLYSYNTTSEKKFKIFPIIHCVHIKGNKRTCNIKKHAYKLCSNTNEQQYWIYNITQNTYWHKYPITMESLHVLSRSTITWSNDMKSCSFKIFGYLEKRALIKDSLLHVIFISIII